jgi:uncharacterized repeat protein (TIGR01451 family)
MNQLVKKMAALFAASLMGALALGAAPANAAGNGPTGVCDNGAINPPDCNVFPSPPSSLKSNLRVYKSAGKSTAVLGDKVSFTITVVCEGDTECGKARVEDVVPANFKVDSVSANGGTVAHNGQSILWTKDLMQQREVTNITVNATALTAGCACNIAQGFAAAPDNPNDNRGEACICVVGPSPTPAPGVTPVPVAPVPLPVTGAGLPFESIGLMVAGLGALGAGLMMRRRK